MTHFRTLTLAFCLATLLPCFSQAAPVTFMGDFDASNFSGDVTPDPFQGSWSFDFDLSELDPAGGLQFFTDIPLTSFAPVTVGSTMFDLSNTSANIDFNSNINTIVVSIADPDASRISSDTDDFLVEYISSEGIPGISSEISLNSVVLTNQGVVGLSQAQDLSGSLTIVPEPSSLALLGMGGLAVTLCLRRSLRSQ